MRSPTTLLVAGGAGFIGSNFVRYVLQRDERIRVVNLDKLTYAGNLENLSDIEDDPCYDLVKGDIADAGMVRHLVKRISPDAIINFAAESHVDRSILGATPFVDTNVRGTLSLLEAAKEEWTSQTGRGSGVFLQISTDEVYGDLGESGRFTEETPLAPNNPYAASKASADLLCRAFHRTHGLPVIVTRCSNNYGPYQFPEKLIPVMVDRATRGERLPVYGDGSNVRDWIHVSDHCRAIDLIIRAGRPGEIYNIGADTEIRNLDLVGMILRLVGRSEDLIEFVRDRPGHDRRYAMDATKLRDELGWRPSVSFEDGLRQTIAWYTKHGEWVARCKSGEYLAYWKANYG